MSEDVKPVEVIAIDEEHSYLLEVNGLKVFFPTEDGVVRAVDTMDLCICEGEKVGLIGESGCGKTVFGHAVMRILDEDAKVTGDIIFRGRRLYSLDRESMRKIRGKEIGMILQNPGASLNPVLTVKDVSVVARNSS